MDYVINVDLESKNVINGGATDCQSVLHQTYGRHFDLTIHAFGSNCYKSNSVDRPPTRYWEPHGDKGYTLAEVVVRLQEIHANNADAHPRRCLVCGVPANQPHWD